MTKFETVLNAASEMSVEDRVRLVDRIASTLSDKDLERYSAEWRAEIARRSAEIIDGTAETEDWEDIRRRAYDRLGVKLED